MILTNREMDHLRQHLEMQAGLDEELLERCNELIHAGKFDEAVRSAFVLLEERLRALINQDKFTGVRLADTAFDPDRGLLAKHLGQTQQERLGLHNIFTGAFRLFRNPTAHKFIGLEANEGRAIIYFVSLLLSILERAAELPPPDFFPEQLEKTLSTLDKRINPNVASQLRIFLGKCQRIGISPSLQKRFTWIPFRSYALQERPFWPDPRKHYIAVFYLVVETQNPAIYFPVNEYYSNVVNFDIESIGKELLALGFLPTGKHGDYRLYLQEKLINNFFNDLYRLVEKIKEEFKATLA